MQAADEIRPPGARPDLRAEWREVVRDVGGEAQAFLRLTLSGRPFARGNDEPVVQIGDAVSRFSVLSPGGDNLSAYFDRSVPEAAEIAVTSGDGSVEIVRIAVEQRKIRALEPFE
jgi:hypothetical protein